MFENLDIARLKYIMTMDCNFRCDYCFEGGKINKNIDIDEAIRIGKQVLNEMKQEQLTVLYFGGEPFLRFKDMRLITQSLALYAPKVGKKINFTSITNGTILTEEIVKHLNAYKYYMSVSCDGIEPSQNTHRGFLNGSKTSFQRVENSIKILNSATRDLCASMVVTDQNLQYLSDSFKWLTDIGVRNFAISPVLDKSQYTPTPEKYELQLKKVAEIASSIPGKLVINPCLDKTWDDDNATRRMYASNESVNVELSPLGLNIIPERSMITHINFSLDGTEASNTPADIKLRTAVIEAEKNASQYYANIKSERKM